MNVYITGDIHGDPRRIVRFVNRLNISSDDLIVILGDAGLNFYLNHKDYWPKLKLYNTGVNILCIHGNHECRPSHLEQYTIKQFHNGKVYYEKDFPNIMFAIDGEVYTLPSQDGTNHKVLVCGGAYSVDKDYRLMNYPMYWWSDEQPDDKIKAKVENKLEKLNWEVDDIFTHTAPLDFEPKEVFLQGVNQLLVDKSTEKWLQSIYDRLKSFKRWYFGHYHCDKVIDNKIFILFETFELL